MIELIQSILAFLLALGILITFHEFGHYWVARRCNVKILRFSVGFGKQIWRFDFNQPFWQLGFTILEGIANVRVARSGVARSVVVDVNRVRASVAQIGDRNSHQKNDDPKGSSKSGHRFAPSR